MTQTNEQLELRLDEHDRRLAALEESDGHAELWAEMRANGHAIAELRGAVRGYLLAGCVIAAALAALAQFLFQIATR